MHDINEPATKAGDAEVIIGPSVLSADFLRLGEQLIEIERAGADYVHFDVMDGRFVPNISIGLPVLEAVRDGTTLPIDVHLMLVEPERWVDPFADAGADSITFHAEASPHLHRLTEAIAKRGMRAGVALNPSTPILMIEPLLPFVGHVLVMTVNPGFGGQSFIPEMTAKVAQLRERLQQMNSDCHIQVDGGINAETIVDVAKAGATSIVAGTALINDEGSIEHNMGRLRKALA
ncbi:MAG: Ribulose-phosphate 3-epimerase [uncultured Thermomicrobiales bacterium]|uniref:Ribulose-phosphate 3-epimerase n=1 Tax=uncultured Thermomicrobiales bacterium TaxID=1645740 RepID=A0A6J4UE14_9BACT|nr:MAG: Ribulose-phosphate 3-epimerase [uncultured Thermomicrobiales bacterium]